MTAALEGLTITGGKAPSALDIGGGVYNAGTLTITQSIVSGNSATGDSKGWGGGIGNAAALTVTNSSVSNNAATRGAGIHNAGDMYLVRATLLQNTSTYGGGGILHTGPVALIRETTISDNSAGTSGGAIYRSWGILTVVDSLLSNNSAQSIGGGVYCGGIAAFTLDASTLAGNSAGAFGGGIYVDSMDATVILNSALMGNSVRHSGGGIYNRSKTTPVNSVVLGNSAGLGGGIFNVDSSATLTVTNSTATGNSAGYGGGICDLTGRSLIINNSLLSLNGGSTGGDLYGEASSGSGYNLIGTDPGFVRNPSDGGDGWGDDPDTPDVDEGANDDYGDLRLRADSPAVNAGSNALAVDAAGLPLVRDLDGMPRVVYGTVDIGAYEFHLAADANLDAAVDDLDASILAARWQTPGGATWADADFNADGRVDDLDGSILAANWQARYTSPAAAGGFAQAGDEGRGAGDEGQAAGGFAQAGRGEMDPGKAPRWPLARSPGPTSLSGPGGRRVRWQAATFSAQLGKPAVVRAAFSARPGKPVATGGDSGPSMPFWQATGCSEPVREAEGLVSGIRGQESDWLARPTRVDADFTHGFC